MAPHLNAANVRRLGGTRFAHLATFPLLMDEKSGSKQAAIRELVVCQVGTAELNWLASLTGWLIWGFSIELIWLLSKLLIRNQGTDQCYSLDILSAGRHWSKNCKFWQNPIYFTLKPVQLHTFASRVMGFNSLVVFFFPEWWLLLTTTDLHSYNTGTDNLVLSKGLSKGEKCLSWDCLNSDQFLVLTAWNNVE